MLWSNEGKEKHGTATGQSTNHSGIVYIFTGVLIGILTTLSAFSQNMPTATELAEEMTIGWNLGNTLEAIGGETAWGNPVTSQRFIDAVKAAGFNTIRLPVAWDNHTDHSSNAIESSWMKRVKEVVDYCINDDLYVMLNIHWDNGWLENNVTENMKASVNVKQKAYWTQIAEYFKHYDGRLLFASANEPNVENAQQAAVLNSYHQTFIDAVRATGGNNRSRVLIIQGPSTDIEKTDKLMTTLPSDPASDRLMVEVHYYTPWNFCGLTQDADWGNMFFYWGQDNHSPTDTNRNPTWGEESLLEEFFLLMKVKFIDNGYPVVLGEYGAIKRNNLGGAARDLHIVSREYFLKYVTAAARRYGLIPVYWDNGAADFSLFNRSSGEITDQGAVDALMDGASGNFTVAATPAGKENGSEVNSLQLNMPAGENCLKLTINDPEQVTGLSIFDQLGRNILSLHGMAIQRTVPIRRHLNTGMYMVRLHTTDGTRTFKIVKYH